jgi:hypothetical protein
MSIIVCKVHRAREREIRGYHAASSCWNDDGSPVVLGNYCDQPFTTFPYFSNFLLDSIRTMLFYTSIYAPDLSSPPVPPQPIP